MKKCLHFLLLLVTLSLISACGGEKKPFEAEYTSRNDVIVTYGGKKYNLNRFKETRGLPFQYSFESDGDLDLTINGRRYEVDSPFDIDKKKATKKTTKKKSSTSKKKKK